ncbi:unnamed protein product [Larinioides sclopetarius]|uniref:Piezo transmembrane helical unit domain-containing protein n=1 Tax=Larinioides sclopetarius TaxID=280406 RepID=A0AAV2APY0_9ARAC
MAFPTKFPGIAEYFQNCCRLLSVTVCLLPAVRFPDRNFSSCWTLRGGKQQRDRLCSPRAQSDTRFCHLFQIHPGHAEGARLLRLLLDLPGRRVPGGHCPDQPLRHGIRHQLLLLPLERERILLEVKTSTAQNVEYIVSVQRNCHIDKLSVATRGMHVLRTAVPQAVLAGPIAGDRLSTESERCSHQGGGLQVRARSRHRVRHHLLRLPPPAAAALLELLLPARRQRSQSATGALLQILIVGWLLIATDYCSYSTPMFSEAVTPEPEEKGPPSPGSAFYTPSLDAYMEPRLRVGGSHQRPPTTEDSFPVFSPPPYPAGAPVDALQYLPEFLQNSGFSSLLLTRYPFLLRFRRAASAPSTHHASIRSGDYYMFEDFSDDDIDLELSARHKRSVDDEDEDSAEVKEKGLNALVEEPRKESGEVDDMEDSSQQSAIVSADRDAATATATSQKKSPDPLTITSSGPTMSLSMPSSASSTSASSPKEDTVAAISPQDVKLVEEEKEETFVEKLKRWYGFFCTFVNSVLISTTAKLNAVSKDYRSSKDLKQVAVVVKKTNLDFLGSCELTSSQDLLDGGSKKHPTFMRFLVALYYAAISRSELLCYIVIVVNQMKAASILSLPLPLFAFLWGTLSAIVVLKYLFQFYFFPWNNSPPPPNNPFYPTIIFGVRKDENYAGYDLAVLLVVFFHRFMLKSLGLWKDTEKSLIIPNVEVTSEREPIEDKDQEVGAVRHSALWNLRPCLCSCATFFQVKAVPEPRKDEAGGEESDGLEECSDGEGDPPFLKPRVTCV